MPSDQPRRYGRDRSLLRRSDSGGCHSTIILVLHHFRSVEKPQTAAAGILRLSHKSISGLVAHPLGWAIAGFFPSQAVGHPGIKQLMGQSLLSCREFGHQEGRGCLISCDSRAVEWRCVFPLIKGGFKGGVLDDATEQITTPWPPFLRGNNYSVSHIVYAKTNLWDSLGIPDGAIGASRSYSTLPSRCDRLKLCRVRRGGYPSGVRGFIAPNDLGESISR